MISVYFCIYLTNRCIAIFCLPTRVIIPYKSKFYNYFSVYFVIFSFNAKFHIYDRKSFQFWKECKSISIFSQRWYLQKKHFNENVERWFWAQTRKLEKKETIQFSFFRWIGQSPVSALRWQLRFRSFWISYKDTTTLSFAHSGRSAAFMDMLKTNFTWYFSLMVSSVL